MTPDELVTMVKGRLLNNTDPTLDALIITETNHVIDILEQEAFKPWFLYTDTDPSSNINLVAGQDWIAYPSDFAKEFEGQYAAFIYADGEDDPWLGLKKDDRTVIKTRYSGSGRPEAYDILGTYIYFAPIPDTVYILRLHYWRKDSKISAGGSANLWLTYAADWIVNEVLAIMSSLYVSLPEIYSVATANAAAAKRRVYVDTVARSEAGALRQMGDTN